MTDIDIESEEGAQQKADQAQSNAESFAVSEVDNHRSTETHDTAQPPQSHDNEAHDRDFVDELAFPDYSSETTRDIGVTHNTEETPVVLRVQLSPSGAISSPRLTDGDTLGFTIAIDGLTRYSESITASDNIDNMEMAHTLQIGPNTDYTVIDDSNISTQILARTYPIN